MGRRVTAGVVGTNGFGSVTIASNTIATAATNQNLVLDPNGTGFVQVNNDLFLNLQGDIRFGDADGSNWVAFHAPATVNTNFTWTLPATDGTANQVLRTDGSGTLSWTSIGVTVSNEESSASVFYPSFSSATSGSIATINVAATKLSFQPSTGTFMASAFAGGTSAGANLVLRSTTNASKGQVFLDETTASTSVTTGALRVAGGVGISGNLYVANVIETSSIVFKENIQPIENALDKIIRLVGVTYDRKDGSTQNEAGLIAEEVEQVIPNLVTRNENNETYGIQYTKLSAYIIEAIKELQEQITDLKVKLG